MRVRAPPGDSGPRACAAPGATRRGRPQPGRADSESDFAARVGCAAHGRGYGDGSTQLGILIPTLSIGSLLGSYPLRRNRSLTDESDSESRFCTRSRWATPAGAELIGRPLVLSGAGGGGRTEVTVTPGRAMTWFKLV